MVNNFGESLLSSMLGKAKEVGTSYQEDVASKAAARLAEMKEKRLAAMGISKEMIGKGYQPVKGGVPASVDDIIGGQDIIFNPPVPKDTSKRGLIMQGGKPYDLMTGEPLTSDADFSRYEDKTPKDTSRMQSKDVFAIEKSLVDDFRKDIGDFPKIRDSFRRVSASAQNPTAAGDLALIFNYMKMLDPGSVVREGEFATAQNAAGIPDRITAAYNKALEGTRLAPGTRADFVDRSKKIYDTMLNQHQNTVKQYTDRAKRYGVDPRNVVLDYESVSTPASAPSPIKSKYANIGLE